MMNRVIGAVLLVMLVSSCGPSLPPTTDEQRAVQVARQQLEGKVPAEVLDRAAVAIRPSRTGWLVVFQEANVPCDQVRWPEACGMPIAARPAPAPFTYRDLFVCVAVQPWQIGQFGGAQQPLGDHDPCVGGPRPVQPTAVPPA